MTPYRIIKIYAGMTGEFELILTNATDEVIKKQLIFINNLEEEGIPVPSNPYGIIEEFDYKVSIIGSQNDFDYEDLENIDIAEEFDFYDL